MDNLTIVMYHYIRDLKSSRYPQIKALDLKLFEKHLEYFQKKFYFITIEEITQLIKDKKNLPKNCVHLTFDDAYIDHYTNVFPLLDKYGIQGSFYVPVKAIKENLVLDVNKIHFILANANINNLIVDVKILLNEIKTKYSLEEFDYYYKKLAVNNRFDSKDIIFFKRLLQVELDKKARDEITNILFERYVQIPQKTFSKELYMNEEQLKHMLRAGMHIGNHGYNHLWWDSLDKEELNKELDLSLDYLFNLGVRKDNWTACYPYGGYDEKSVDLLQQKACKLAFTTEVKKIDTQNCNSLLLPRLDANDINKYII